MSATVVMVVILTVWVVPWVTIGMTLDDYSFPVRVALVLTVASACMGLVAFLMRESVGGPGGLVEVWHNVLGKRGVVTEPQPVRQPARHGVCARPSR